MQSSNSKIADKIVWIKTKAPPNLGTMLGMEFTILEADKVAARMEVLDRVKQPFGILHGGATVALVESVASIGAWLNVSDGFSCVGIEVNANHLRSVSSGWVIATGIPLHRGRRSQVWSVEVQEEITGQLIAQGRCTLMVIPDLRQGD